LINIKMHGMNVEKKHIFTSYGFCASSDAVSRVLQLLKELEDIALLDSAMYAVFYTL